MAPKEEDTEYLEEDDFWEPETFIESISSEDVERKMKSVGMKHDEDVNYSCKKCNKKISLHNRDWHNGMCDDCFNKFLKEGK
jgi:hypothetical protein